MGLGKTRRSRIFWIWIPLALLAVLGVSAAQGGTAHDIDDDGIAASTTGARVTGTLHWLTFAGDVFFTVTVADTLADGHCADLYVRQRNIAGASSGWRFFVRQCGAGTARTWNGSQRHTFPGGTAYFDFRIQRSGVGNYATDLNQLGGA